MEDMGLTLSDEVL
jgi:hypothetical protein